MLKNYHWASAALLLVLTSACTAGDQRTEGVGQSATQGQSVLDQRFVPVQTVMGDFDGDGVGDTAQTVAHAQSVLNEVSISVEDPWEPWSANGGEQGDLVSLAVVHGGESKGKAPDTLFVGSTGAMNTSSFELVVYERGTAIYTDTVATLPKAPVGDILMLPTEAGIATYIYWTGNEYFFHVPDEIP